jgi:hypothetical protein
MEVFASFQRSQKSLRFTAERFEKLAGGKRSATTGLCLNRIQ